MRDKSKKKAIIFGGSSGIGFATAELLVKNGVDVAIVSQNQDRLNMAKRRIKEAGIAIQIFAADASDLASMKRVFAEIKKKFGTIDYLVNATGVSILQKQGVLDIEAFTRLIDINLKSAYLVSMLYGYGLMNRGGSIVNIASVRGRTGTDSFSQGYAAAKAGVINLTKTFAKEFAPRNIRVNCVAPGAIYPTGMSKSWPRSLRRTIAQSIPLNRLGRPEEVAKAILFLLSDNASYITGQTIDINGGQWMN